MWLLSSTSVFCAKAHFACQRRTQIVVNRYHSDSSSCSHTPTSGLCSNGCEVVQKFEIDLNCTVF